MSNVRPRLFIGSSTKSLPIANVLQQQLQTDAVVNVWNQGVFGVTDYTLDRLLAAAKDFDFAAFVFAADDLIELGGERHLVARDNVVLELGLFTGQLGRRRTFLVVQDTPEGLHLPSDLKGLTYARFIWPAGTPFNDRVRLHAELGPAAESLRVAMQDVGPDKRMIKSLSGGMVFVALCLRERSYSLEELAEELKQYQLKRRRAKWKDVGAWRKITKYACQCLEGVGMLEIFGSDEFELTKLGREVLGTEKMQERFSDTYAAFNEYTHLHRHPPRTSA